MNNTKKEQERSALHATIWKIANDLRGSVDGWDFKQYVLGMLFYRFISENITIYINEKEREAGRKNFDYTLAKDKDVKGAKKDIVEEKGFFILPSELFENVRKKASEDANLNETLEKVFHNIEASAKGTESEDDLKGLFDDLDVNSNKLGSTVKKRNEILTKLLNSIGELNLQDKYDDNATDIFGDAYEYLMNMYAANAGKSGGEFFTPQEVLEIYKEISGAQWGTSFKMLGENGVLKYYLLHLTNHDLGREKIKQIFWKLDPSGDFSVKQRSLNQMSFFDDESFEVKQFDDSELEQWLYTQLANTGKTWAELRVNLLEQNWIHQQLWKTIKRLKKSNVLSCERLKDGIQFSQKANPYLFLNK